MDKSRNQVEAISDAKTKTQPYQTTVSENESTENTDEDDSWPPGWSESKKQNTDPTQWPLTKDEVSRLKTLLERLGKQKKPTPSSIAKLIGKAGVWDVTHPMWKLEGRKGIGNHVHPDKVSQHINTSRKHGVIISSSEEDDLKKLATTAFQGEQPAKTTPISVVDNTTSL